MLPGDSDSYELSPCPRCGNPAKTIPEQLASCRFCAERGRQMAQNRGRAMLQQPTAEFPTWRATVAAD